MFLSIFLNPHQLDEPRVLPRVPPYQRGEADDEGEHPGGQDEQLGPLGRHDVGVGDGVRDGDVAVQADHHQVEDGGGARPHVHSQPDGAPDVAKDPKAEDLQEGEGTSFFGPFIPQK